MNEISDYQCPHCLGSGSVTDEWSPDGYASVGCEFPCEACDATGLCPVDGELVCACGECVHLPAEERFRLEPLPDLRVSR